jgi:HEPN domain-containing protein
MSKVDVIKEWFYLAENDLKSAIFLKGMSPIPMEIICYHCQQSAEKYLKGFLAFHDEKIIKTHDLIVLNNLCSNFNSEFGKIEDFCLRLTDYSTNIRYPATLDITRDDMDLAIIDATKIQEFILKIDYGF